MEGWLCYQSWSWLSLVRVAAATPRVGTFYEWMWYRALTVHIRHMPHATTLVIDSTQTRLISPPLPPLADTATHLPSPKGMASSYNRGSREGSLLLQQIVFQPFTHQYGQITLSYFCSTPPCDQPVNIMPGGPALNWPSLLDWPFGINPAPLILKMMTASTEFTFVWLKSYWSWNLQGRYAKLGMRET